MTPARRPSADQAMACYLIASAARMLDAVIADRLAQYGASPGQLPTLLALYGQDGQTQADLAREIGVEQPTMAVNLQRMERNGLIERRPDPAHRRKVQVWLTAHARTIEEPIRGLRREIDHDALAGLGPTAQRQLRASLTQLITNLHALKGEPSRSAHEPKPYQSPPSSTPASASSSPSAGSVSTPTRHDTANCSAKTTRPITPGSAHSNP